MHFCAFTGIPESVNEMKAAGFDSITSYNVTTMSSGLKLPEQPFEPYAHMVERHEGYWDAMDKGELPYAPVVTVGWDVTYRWESSGVPWPPTNQHYPYTPIVNDSNPQLFGDLVRRARRHAAASPKKTPYILVNAWNEWTEGSALLPDARFGTGYLKALRDAMDAPMQSEETKK